MTTRMFLLVCLLLSPLAQADSIDASGADSGVPGGDASDATSILLAPGKACPTYINI